MRLIWKLLRQHISVLQLAGFFLANLVGVSIILCGVQIYNDLKPVISGDNSIVSNDYIVISKRISTDNMLVRDATMFSREEIEDLKAQPFVERVGEFSSAQFKVSGSLQMLNAYTMMFFESVPDSFIDVKSDKWHFTPGDTTIPIIIPRAYLNLYNFGFSMSRAGLPQLSEDFLKDLPIQITIRANNGSVINYESYIVGYSHRINTILVPESFLNWANREYGYASSAFNSNTPQGPSRLIFETNNPSDTEIGKYLEKRGYTTENNDSATSKMNYLLNVAMVVIVTIGAIFSILSLAILTLSIYLLLQKNTTKLGNLVLAGYTPHMVAAPYKLLTILLNLAVTAGALVATFAVRSYYLGKLSEVFGQNFVGTTSNTLIVAVAITLAVILFNVLIIQRKVDAISRKR
jgi:hypothetical protein